MIKTQNNRARLASRAEVKQVFWDAALAGLDPDGVVPRPAGTGSGDYCLASDVEEAQLAVAAKLHEQVDQLCERIAAALPHLLAVDLLAIRRAYLEALAPLLGH